MAALSLGTASCSDTGEFGARASPAAFLHRVIVLMAAQPRMVVRLTGGSIARAVIDTKAQYLALFSTTGLVMLERDGVAYREENGCYHVFRAGHPRTQSLWAGVVDDVTGGPHAIKLSGENVIYRSSRGALTVDTATGLVRSVYTLGVPAGGVAPTRVTFSYPPSVTRLSPPTHLCH